MPEGTRRGPYAKTRAVRGRILDAATEVFAETGFRATTMKEIAGRAGISERGLVHHFPGKEALLSEVLERREAETAKLVATREGLSAIGGLIAVIRENLTRPGLLELQSTLTAEAISSEHPAHDHFQNRYTDFRAYLTTLFGELRDRGLLSSTLEPRNLASMYIALNDGLQVQWLYSPDSVDVEAVLREFLISVCPAFADVGMQALEPASRSVTTD